MFESVHIEPSKSEALSVARVGHKLVSHVSHEIHDVEETRLIALIIMFLGLCARIFNCELMLNVQKPIQNSKIPTLYV